MSFFIWMTQLEYFGIKVAIFEYVILLYCDVSMPI